MRTEIKPVSQGLSFLTAVMNLFSAKEITIPNTLHGKVEVVNDTLNNDVSGLVNSVLDFAISAANVTFSVESNRASVSNALNDWLSNVNESLRGKIPTGINEFAKQYFIERWKKSSFILVRTKWEDRDGFYLPTKLWLVDGKDVKISDEVDTKEIGKEQYYLKISKDKYIELPRGDDEKIFVQKPFESWTSDYPTPYLIRKGTYYNVKALQILSEKGTSVVAKALEYMMLIKKGDKDLAKTQNPDFIYSEKELQDIKTKFQSLSDELRSTTGIPMHVTNFDTNLEHIIPEFEKILKGALYAPIERRILASLGFIEVVEGVTTSRKDSIINPKVFMSEVQSGVNDFSSLLKDILITVIKENKKLRPKLMNSDIIQIRTSPIKQFLNQDAKEFLRSQYDRGLLSKRTFVELCGDMDFDAEIERRNVETENKLDEKMFPPMIQNINQGLASDNNPDPKSDENLPEDKSGPEKKNYTAQNLNSIYSVPTSRKKNHSHDSEVIINYDKDGHIISCKGRTNIKDDHAHTISSLDQTDPASDGHFHKLNFEKSNIDIDSKNKIIKFQNLVGQAKLLEKLNEGKK